MQHDDGQRIAQKVSQINKSNIFINIPRMHSYHTTFQRKKRMVQIYFSVIYEVRHRRIRQ